MRSTICLAEDREACEAPLKLLLLSLTKHCPETTINLFYPPATDDFITWIRKCPQVYLQTARLKIGYGWNIKPQAIMRLMDAGYDEVIWIDSDIIVNRNPIQIFGQVESDTIVAAEDALGDSHEDRNALRARLWGFPVGRVLPFGLNTGVLRVTKDHYHLMVQWWELLQSRLYQEAQQREWRQRPTHMLGDQDVLTALVTSSEFSQIPLYLLRRGKHIIQFDGVWGYTIAERMRHLGGNIPTFIHQFGHKPWSERSWASHQLKEYIKRIYLDLSPYTFAAMAFRRESECDTEWMEPHYMLSRILRVLGMGHPAFVGFPMAVFLDLVRIARVSLQGPRGNEVFGQEKGNFGGGTLA
jgi:hypothetical protein